MLIRPTAERSIVMSVSVCLLSSIFVTTRSIFTKFLCMLGLPIAVAGSSSGDVAIRYLITNGFMDDVTFEHYGPCPYRCSE